MEINIIRKHNHLYHWLLKLNRRLDLHGVTSFPKLEKNSDKRQLVLRRRTSQRGQAQRQQQQQWVIMIALLKQSNSRI